jgi:hypothetical protein
MSNNDPKNGLKVGDKVIRKLDESEGAFSKDRGPYTIVAIDNWGGVTLDRGPKPGWGPHGWDAVNFVKAQVQDNVQYILILRDNGVYLPADKPRTYTTEAQAKAVAASMAEKNPGAEFVIFKAVGKAKTNTATVEMF